LPRRLVRDFYHAPSAAPEPVRRALQAIMLDEDAARASVSRHLLQEPGVCRRCVITGFAGSLFAHHAHYLNPNDFHLLEGRSKFCSWSSSRHRQPCRRRLGAFVVTLCLISARPRTSTAWSFRRDADRLMGLGHRGLAGVSAAVAMRLPAVAATIGHGEQSDPAGRMLWPPALEPPMTALLAPRPAHAPIRRRLRL